MTSVPRTWVGDLATCLYEAGTEGCKATGHERLKPKVQELLAILAEDQFQKPPPFEKLVGDLAGACSRRINIQRRLVYQVLEEDRVVKVLRLWSHYE